MRWVIGDVQGCAAELEDLLTAIEFEPERDEVWLAGDIINRGPASLQAMRLWLEIGGLGVLGNHEVYALRVRDGAWPRKKDTLQELFDAEDADALFDHLQALPVLVHLPSQRGPEAWLVHAAVSPAWDDLHATADRLNALPHDGDWIESPDVKFATRARCCTPEGKMCKWDGLPGGCPPPSRPWDALYTGGKLVVHGHWAQRGYYRGPRTIGLDSGCIYGGPLTAWCQDEDRIVQVPCRQSGGYR